MMTNVLFPLSLNFYRDKPKLDSLKYLNISLVTISLSWSGREDTEQITFQKIGLFMATSYACAQATDCAGLIQSGMLLDSMSLGDSEIWFLLPKI